MKLLIDECLSEELTKFAQEQGHPESSHVRWLGKGGWQDRNLMPVIVAGDWTLVTKNSVDFRGPAKTKGNRGLHSRTELHAGLICLNGPVGMDLDMQLDLIAVALEHLGPEADLINQCFEVTLDDEGAVSIVRYALPKNGK